MRLSIRLGCPLALLALALAAALGYTLIGPVTQAPQPGLSVAEGLTGGDDAGFAKVLAPRRFSFPADHGPHPEYRTEWWYFTGNLDTARGRHFGYQLTLFRIALTAKSAERKSAWAASQIYMGHFAVTDVAAGRFHAFGRFSRAALGLAGAQVGPEIGPFRVWLEDWQVQGQGPEALPMHLRAAQGSVAVDLTLNSAEAPVLQGEQGLSRKSAEPGNASYYYSLTRMPTSGVIRIGTQAFEVRGSSWMDREWSTSALAKDQVGWDWLALQLSGDRELMFYRLRRRDGSADLVSAGSLVIADGSMRRLAASDVQIEVLEHWRSPRGVRYPSRWRLRVPLQQLDLTITPYLSDQELDVGVRYWEGAVRIAGTAGSQPVTGSGYAELTGYGDAPASGP